LCPFFVRRENPKKWRLWDTQLDLLPDESEREGERDCLLSTSLPSITIKTKPLKRLNLLDQALFVSANFSWQMAKGRANSNANAGGSRGQGSTELAHSTSTDTAQAQPAPATAAPTQQESLGPQSNLTAPIERGGSTTTYNVGATSIKQSLTLTALMLWTSLTQEQVIVPLLNPMVLLQAASRSYTTVGCRSRSLNLCKATRALCSNQYSNLNYSIL